MKFSIVISYDGTEYCGWQVQPNGTSVQTLVQKALQTVLRRPISLIGASRTDAGVHALGQVAHFTADPIADPAKIIYSLNCLLPPTIRILELTPVADDFHARYSARGKIYHYNIHTERALDPFTRLYRTPITYKIDRALLEQALQHFVGTHDFTSFANEASQGAAAQNPVKTIARITVCDTQGGYRIEFEGDGFLYKMIRNLMGTALEVASRKRELSSVAAILASKDRRLAGATAPPQGLVLVKINY